MRINSIGLENFGLFAGRQSLEPVSREDNKGSITLIGGLNGRGKTSLLEALLLALYGRRTPALDNSRLSYSSYLESLVHRGVPRDEGAAVELEMEVFDGTDTVSLRVRRAWRAPSIRMVERLEIWRNGIPDAVLAENWDTFVEDLIPVAISGLFFFDGEKIGSLAEVDETSSSVKTAIGSLLGIDIIDRLIADLNLVIQRNRSQLKEVPESEQIEQMEAELGALIRTKLMTEQRLAGLSNKIDRARNAVRAKEREYLAAGGPLIESRENLLEQKRYLVEQVAANSAQIVAAASGPMPLLLVRSVLERVQELADHETQVKRAKALLPILESRDQQLADQLEQLDGLDKSTVAKVIELMAESRSEWKGAEGPDGRFSLSETSLGILKHLVSRDFPRLMGEAEFLLSNSEHLDLRLAQVDQHLAFEVDEQAATSLLRELTEAAQRVGELESERVRLNDELASLNNKVDALTKRRHLVIESVLGRIDMLDDSRRSISLALRSQEVMRKFKVSLTRQKIGALAAAVTEAFLELIQKSRLVSSIHIDPESFQIILLDSAGNQVPKNRLSSGEKQMLAIAILWGLANASGRELPIVVDTPLGRLDSSHRMNFVSKYLPRASHQVIVLSTDTEIVGETMVCLGDALGKTYLLSYDEHEQLTKILPGYFS